MDWYGNARPLFLGNRVFALMGYEIVEGALAGNALTETRRISFSPGDRQPCPLNDAGRGRLARVPGPESPVPGPQPATRASIVSMSSAHAGLVRWFASTRRESLRSMRDGHFV